MIEVIYKIVEVELSTNSSSFFQGVKFAVTSPERLEYTAEHSQILTPTTDKKKVEKEIKGEIGL